MSESSSNSQGDSKGVDIRMAQIANMEAGIMETLVIVIKLVLLGIFCIIGVSLPLYSLTFLPWEDD